MPDLVCFSTVWYIWLLRAHCILGYAVFRYPSQHWSKHAAHCGHSRPHFGCMWGKCLTHFRTAGVRVSDAFSDNENEPVSMCYTLLNFP